MTLNQKYYQINTVINTYMMSKGISCRVIKYGIDPATLRKDSVNSTDVRYPYMQTFVSNAKEQPWTSEESGILTDFDFQLSFFTGVRSEKVNDEKYFYPFEVAKNLLGDIDLNLLDGIADIKGKEGPYKFDVKSGQAVPAAVMIYKMRAVCSYEAIVPPAGESTNIDAAITITGS